LKKETHPIWFAQWDVVEPYRREVCNFEMTVEEPKAELRVGVGQFVTQSFCVYAKYHERVRHIIDKNPQESAWFIYPLLALPHNGLQLAFEQVYRAIRGDMPKLQQYYSRTSPKE
jgi:hypothetical protein